MLSPGKFHLKVPREKKANLRFRMFILRKARNNPKLQAVLRWVCKHDIVFYVSAFCWQFNPKKQGRTRVAPFIPWDFQIDALLSRDRSKPGILWCYEKSKPCVVEKSREMGASWLFLIFQDWLGLFHDFTQTLNISRSAEAVDAKSPNSLFWKMRFMHQRLPRWLKGEIVEQNMYFEYKQSLSFITGEASTSKSGVGGRASVIFVDEFPQIRDAAEMSQRTASTSDCRFFNGTHLGEDTEFFRMTHSPEFVKIQMHWTQHPDKNKGLYKFNVETNQVEILDKSYVFPEDYEFIKSGLPTGGPHPGVRSPWYDAKCREIGNSFAVSQELDIDAAGSVRQFFDSLTIGRYLRTLATPPFWQGEVICDQDSGKFIEARPGAEGHLKLWVNLNSKNEPPIGKYTGGIDAAMGTGATPSVIAFVNAVTGEKVLEYCNPHIRPIPLAILCVCLCRWFRGEDGEGVAICWEMVGPGEMFGDRVVEMGYRNIFFREPNNHAVLHKSISMIPGWYPSKADKKALLEEFRHAMDSGAYVERSEDMLKECPKFQYEKDGSVEHTGFDCPDPSGARVNHGDRVIASALAWKMAKRIYVAQRKEEEEYINPLSLAYRKKMAENRLHDSGGWTFH